MKRMPLSTMLVGSYWGWFFNLSSISSRVHRWFTIGNAQVFSS